MIITSELFGSEARGKAVSIATLVNWSCNFLVTVTFPFIQVDYKILVKFKTLLKFVMFLKASIGSYSFILFGCILIIFSIFMLLFLPETKGRTSDEIKEIFQDRFIFIKNA